MDISFILFLLTIICFHFIIYILYKFINKFKNRWTKHIIFELYITSHAPFHVKPEKCYIINKSDCNLWNCKYHFKDNKYDVCQLKEE